MGNPFIPGFYFDQNTRSTNCVKMLLQNTQNNHNNNNNKGGGGGGGEGGEKVTLSNCGITQPDYNGQSLNNYIS